MHHQPSYDKAIGGSFEDEVPTHHQQQQQQQQLRMRKQESYMMAVGEMSPVAEIPAPDFHIGSLPVSPRINNYTSGTFYEQELQHQQQLYYQQQQQQYQQQQQPLRMRKQESYLMAVGEMSPVAEIPPPVSSTATSSAFKMTKLTSSPKIRKQDSYLRAIR